MTLRKLYRYFLGRLRPYKYMEKVGVNFPRGGVHIYGRVYWNTEPWLITLGNNVHITDGVKFITHDGGTLLYRKFVPDLEITKPITIGNDVYIGNNVIILPGITIGNNCVIKNSIILNDVYIGDNTVIENCIVESHSTINPNEKLGSEDSEVQIINERNFRYSL